MVPGVGLKRLGRAHLSRHRIDDQPGLRRGCISILPRAVCIRRTSTGATGRGDAHAPRTFCESPTTIRRTFLFAGRGPQEARQDLQLGWGSFWARTWLTWSHSPVPPGQAVSGLLGRAVTGACSRLSSRIGAAVVGRSTPTPGPYGGGPASVGSKLGRHPPRRVRGCWSRRG